MSIVLTAFDFLNLLFTVLNSAFASAFVSALAGAAFGAWGAHKIAENAAKKANLIASLNQANAVIVLGFTVVNNILAFKKQHIGPMMTAFLHDQSIAKEANIRMLAGLPPLAPLAFNADLKTTTPVSLPVAALTERVFSANLMPGRALAIAAMLDQAYQELLAAMALRGQLVDQFKARDLPPLPLAQEYFGLQTKEGDTNAMYSDSMTAVFTYTNDVAFFGAELSDELVTHAAAVKKKLDALRVKAAKAAELDFSEARASGLLPPSDDYEDWLKGVHKAV